MSFADGMKALSEPLTKLIEAVSGAIGKAYEPRHMRKLTDAKVYQIERISEAIRKNSDLPIVYTGDEPSINISDYEELRKRAGYRLAYQEISKQENIESIVDKAYIDLEGKEMESSDDISPEWMNRFINMAGEISTEEMQRIWAKVLAGEVVKPSSFSMKTLDCLSNMSQKDAELFSKIANYVVTDMAVYGNSDINSKYNIQYADMLMLDDCGLINSNGAIMTNKVENKKQPIMWLGEYCLFAQSEKQGTIEYREYPLTRAGKELFTIAQNKDIGPQYLIDVANSLKKEYPDIMFYLHKITARNQNSINVNEEESLV